MEVKLEKEDYEELISYCIDHKNWGRMKYFWEISVPDYAYKEFLAWLDKCGDACLTYAFVVIKRYKEHRLLYGFSNFEIIEDMSITCFDFKFENDDILRDRFHSWIYESEGFLVPFSLLGYFKVAKAISAEASKHELFNVNRASDDEKS